jgi:hypothetical protein
MSTFGDNQVPLSLSAIGKQLTLASSTTAYSLHAGASLYAALPLGPDVRFWLSGCFERGKLSRAKRTPRYVY